MVLTGWCDYRLAILSVLISVFSSYAALDLARQVPRARRLTRWLWLTGATTAMAIGIWSMHYTAMFAFSLPVPVSYHWPTVLLSFLPAFCVSAVAFYLVCRRKVGVVRMLAGGTIIGSGIAALHYTAMAAWRSVAVDRYDAVLVAVSVVSAITFSEIALGFEFYVPKDIQRIGWRHIASALSMGAAISVMHYTGMAATTFWLSAVAPDLVHTVSISSLGTVGILVATFVVQAAAVLTSRLDRRFTAGHELSARILQSQDEERQRIARQLHETVAQNLIALKMNLTKISREGGGSDASAKAAIADSIALTDDCLKEVRTLSHLLHPPLLEQAGLLSGLRWYAAGFQERSGITVRLELPPDLKRLPQDVETAVFRIVQECLTNIHRHSGSAVATIRIASAGDSLRVEVEDEGRGMPAQVGQQAAPLGVGIAGMRERVEQLGGTLEINSGKHGTKVTAILPMNGREMWEKSA